MRYKGYRLKLRCNLSLDYSIFKMIWLIIVSFVILTSVQSLSVIREQAHQYQNNKCSKVEYSFYYLTLLSVGSFCEDNICNNPDHLDSPKLVIHGFWPATTNVRSLLSCFGIYRYDPYCTDTYEFNKSLFTYKQLNQLKTYWPKLKQNDIWRYQWQKHGTCYMWIMKNIYNSRYSDKNILKDYFLQSIEKAKSLNISLQGTYNSKEKLAKAMNLNPKQFEAICHDDNILQQIKVCYGLSPTPGAQKIINCPQSNNRDICRFPIQVI